MGNVPQQDGICRNLGTVGVVTAISALATPTLAALALHPDAIDGDVFDTFADFAAWDTSMDARFPNSEDGLTGWSYAEGGVIDAIARPYFGAKTYTFPSAGHLYQYRILNAPLQPAWQRAIFYIPTDATFDFNQFHAFAGMYDTIDPDTFGGNTSARPIYNVVDEVFILPDGVTTVPFAKATLFGRWHVGIMKFSNVGGTTTPTYAYYLDGVRIWSAPDPNAPSPMPTTGMQYFYSWFGDTLTGSGMSLALWELVPGANPYSLAGA